MTEFAFILIGVLSVFITQIFQLIRDARNRKWDLQDREISRVLIAATLKNHQDLVSQTVQDNHEQLITKIDLTTQISEAAFKEANTVNQKIEKLGIIQNEILKHKEK